MAGMSERAQLQMVKKISRLEEEERQRKAAAGNPPHAPAPLPPAGVSTTDKQARPKLGQASSSDDPSFDVGAMVVVDDPKYVDEKTGQRTAYKIMHFQASSRTDRNIALACPLTALRARLPLPPCAHRPRRSHVRPFPYPCRAAMGTSTKLRLPKSFRERWPACGRGRSARLKV